MHREPDELAVGGAHKRSQVGSVRPVIGADPGPLAAWGHAFQADARERRLAQMDAPATEPSSVTAIRYSRRVRFNAGASRVD